MKLLSKNSKFFGFLCLAILVGIFILVLPSNVHSPKSTIAPVIEDVPSDEIPLIKSEIVLENLQKPWDLDFLPDNSIIFTEKEGKVSILKEGEAKLIHTVENVFNVGEGGLMGMAVDSNFVKNRYIYACYDTSDNIQVSRWKLSADATKLEEQNNIITDIPIRPDGFTGRHSGCQVEFVNNVLWVGTGDVAVGTFPQDPGSLGGKILRVDRDGKAVDGNLPEPFDSRIFSYGHRNTQGLALYDQPKAGNYGFSVEHGTSVDDEVNPLKIGNFGWDPTPGYQENADMTDLIKFPDAIPAVWSSGNPTTAPSGADFIKGKNWKAYDGALAVAVLKGRHLMVLRFDSEQKVISEQRLFANEFGRIRSVNSNSKAEVYITTDNGENRDKIIRLTSE